MRIATCFISLISDISAFASDPAYWPQWRGPSGQGYVTDTRVPLEWSENKNLLWKLNLPGAGHSTPVIWGDRLFLTCANEAGTQYWVVCVDTAKGKILWQDVASKGITD